MKKRLFFAVITFVVAYSSLLSFDSYKAESVFINTNNLNLNDCLIYDDSTCFFCGDKGSVIKSQDKGKTLHLIRYHYSLPNLSSIAANSNNEIFFTNSSTSILKSSDLCETWQEIFIEEGLPLNKIMFFENFSVLVSGSRILKGDLSGSSWEKIDLDFSGNITCLIWNNNKYIISTDNGSIYISSDIYNWDLLETFPERANNIEVYSDSTVLIGFNKGIIRQLNTNTNETVKFGGFKVGNHIQQIIRLSDTLLLIYTIDKDFEIHKNHYISTDNGSTWVPLVIVIDINKINYNKQRKIGLGCGSMGSITIGCDTIVKQAGYDRPYQYGYYTGLNKDDDFIHDFKYISAESERALLVSCKSSGLFISNDSGLTISKLVQADDTFNFCKIIGDQDYLYISDSIKWVSGKQINKSFFYRLFNNENILLYESNWGESAEKVVDNKAGLIIAYWKKGFHYSTNNGHNWETEYFPEDFNCRFVYISKDNIIYASTLDSKIIVSSDFGKNWELLYTLNGNFVSYAAISGGEIIAYKSETSTDRSLVRISAEGIKEIYSFSKDKINHLQVLSDNSVLVFHNSKIIHYSPASDSFTELKNETGLAFKEIGTLYFDCLNDSTFYIASSLDSIYRIKLNRKTLSVQGNSADSIELLHPNPVKDLLNIPFEMLDSEFVIYNINGEKLKEGISPHRIINCADLPTGTYLLKLSLKNAYKYYKFIK